jgi:hypothetical protein
MKKATLLALIFVIQFSLLLPAQELLTNLITQKKWPELAAVFADNSYTPLENYFGGAQSIQFVEQQANRFVYKVKYADFAEVGNLSFSKENNLYALLKIDIQITPIHFIDGFKKYAVSERDLTIGDARVHFDKGFFYLAWPARQPLLFEGQWHFELTPGDAEERLTLERLYKKEAFSQANETGIFILDDLSFLKELAATGEDIIALDSPGLKKAYQVYQRYFGIPSKQFNEVWYLPIADNDNLLIFPRDREEDLFYLYNFNSQLTPDTQLRTSDNKRFILSYNAIKELKLSFKKSEMLSELNLSLFYNPEENFLSGTSTLVFAAPRTFRSLSLDIGLKIKANIDPNAGSISLMRKNDNYFILGPEINSLSFFYSGNIKHDDEYSDLLTYIRTVPDEKTTDNFFFLSRTQNFYPNPGYDFSKTSISVNLPQNMNCLASGILAAANNVKTRNLFKFVSPGSKGISLICGDFKKVKRLETRIPINVFANTNFNYEKYISNQEMESCLDFLIDRFGPIDIPEINVLFRRWEQDGGVSNQGFVVCNIDETNAKMIRDIGPMIFNKSRCEYFLHELAHQWWGGQLSWSTYRDEWITEGFATLATIIYLREKLSAKSYRDVLQRMKKWVFKYAECGPVCYGLRIANLERNYESFQSVVYLKSALVLLMLDDLLGQEELFKRLRLCLEKFKYKSVTSTTLINEISKKEDWLLKFFNGWVFSRKIPEITCQVKLLGKTAELRVSQKDTDFVFPLRVRIETGLGKKNQQVIVQQKDQVFTFSEAAAIESLKVDVGGAPVVIKD